MPAEYMQAVSVITKDSGFADGLSTMLFLMPVEDGLELVEGMDGVSKHVGRYGRNGRDQFRF